MGYIPFREAVKRLGLHKNTLRKYADNGSIPSIRKRAGQRLFDVESYLGASVGSATVCYCLLSSSKQRDDLSQQVAYMQSLYPQAEIVKDIGSGLNFIHEGLRSLLDRFLKGDKLTIVVACKDRLCRFGFFLIQYLVEQNSGNIVVLDQTVYCPQSELTQDLLSIVHVNSSRMQDGRKYGKKIKEDPNLPKP